MRVRAREGVRVGRSIPLVGTFTEEEEEERAAGEGGDDAYGEFAAVKGGGEADGGVGEHEEGAAAEGGGEEEGAVIGAAEGFEAAADVGTDQAEETEGAGGG